MPRKSVGLAIRRQKLLGKNSYISPAPVALTTCDPKCIPLFIGRPVPDAHSKYTLGLLLRNSSVIKIAFHLGVGNPAASNNCDPSISLAKRFGPCWLLLNLTIYS